MSKEGFKEGKEVLVAIIGDEVIVQTLE